MGADIHIENGYIRARAGRLKGARLVLDTVTVTGTENLMMAASLAEGETILENAAREPEVVDLAQFLIAMGAKITRRRHRHDRHRGRRAPARHQLRSAARSHRGRHLPRRRRDHRRPRAGAAMPGPSTSTRCWASCARRAPTSIRGDDFVEVDMRGRRPRSVDIRTAPYPAFPDRHAGAVRGAEHGRGRRRHDRRDDLREPLHAHARDAAHGRGDPPRGQHRHHQGRAEADGCAGDGDRPARLGQPGARRAWWPRARPTSSASTTSIAATSASRRSSQGLGAQIRRMNDKERGRG